MENLSITTKAILSKEFRVPFIIMTLFLIIGVSSLSIFVVKILTDLSLGEFINSIHPLIFLFSLMMTIIFAFITWSVAGPGLTEIYDTIISSEHSQNKNH
jgi:hypothetical protein